MAAKIFRYVDAYLSGDLDGQLEGHTLTRRNKATYIEKYESARGPRWSGSCTCSTSRVLDFSTVAILLGSLSVVLSRVNVEEPEDPVDWLASSLYVSSDKVDNREDLAGTIPWNGGSEDSIGAAIFVGTSYFLCRFMVLKVVNCCCR